MTFLVFNNLRWCRGDIVWQEQVVSRMISCMPWSDQVAIFIRERGIHILLFCKFNIKIFPTCEKYDIIPFQSIFPQLFFLWSRQSLVTYSEKYCFSFIASMFMPARSMFKVAVSGCVVQGNSFKINNEYQFRLKRFATYHSSLASI